MFDGRNFRVQRAAGRHARVEDAISRYRPLDLSAINKQ